MRLCKACGQYKPFDPTQKLQSKACGFMGKLCWSCYAATQRTKMQKRMSPADRSYGALVRKAQSALDKLADIPDTPETVHTRKVLEYDLQRAQNKADRFGADAYDFTPAEVNRAIRMAKSDVD